jgi:glycine betaine/proline transport system permease protein
MEWLVDLITDNKLPIGFWAKQFTDWAKDAFEGFFDVVTVVLKTPMDATTDLLLAIPPLVLIVLFTGIAYLLQRNWRLVVLVALGLLFILNQGMWKATVETLVLAIYATAISLLLGIPLGILAARRKWVWAVMSPILDLMQTLPTFIYLVPMLAFFGLGIVPGVIATVIFAIPAPIRQTYLGLTQVPNALVEAGESFGCDRWQLLTRVKIPAALPIIMAGVNQCIMLSLSMVVIAALVGAGGLGGAVVRALGQNNIALGVESGLSIVIVAIVLDRILRWRVRSPNGARSSTRPRWLRSRLTADAKPEGLQPAHRSVP